MGLAEPNGRTSTAGILRRLGGTGVESYYGWGRAVYGPGRGEVVTVSDGLNDRAATGPLNTVAIWIYATFFFRPSTNDDGVPDISPNVGNHVMVELEPGGVAFYAHLQNGSIRVGRGDRVEDQTAIGLVGNSGNTTAPHLHVHVLDQMRDLMSAQLVPFVFSRYERWDGTDWIGESEAIPEPGQIVRAIET